MAYADFVTAMMALFMVLWIVASSQEMKESIAGYFRSTSMLNMTPKAIGSLAPITQVSRTQARLTPPTPSSSGDPGGEVWAYRVLAAQATLRETASSLQKVLRRNNNELTDEDAFRFEFTNDGFRIQAMDKSEHPLFEPGSSKITEYGQWILSTIAWEIERHPFRIEVEGHTQSGTSSAEQDVNAWELSTGRAVAAQRFLEEKGLRPSQFFRVAGYADRVPLEADRPDLELNRRITVILRLDANSNLDSVRRAFSPP